jgi:SAM-dependent MidA family methyltransferase
MSDSKDSRAPTLADRLRGRIRRDGPITFHDWMQAALYDEHGGYYRRADRIRQGRAGDYRTGPETSPLFGATFANYFAQCYSDLGSPSKWTIIEKGAGPGDFARAVLATLRKEFPEVFAATHYLIDDVGDEARNAAAQKLTDYADRVEFRSLSEVTSPLQGIIFSNELLDAFPVHRVLGGQDGLREMYVDVNDAREFVWTQSALSPRVAVYCQETNLQLGEGQIFEVNVAAEDFVARAASQIERGLLVTVDYGADRADLLSAPHRFAGTLRSFHRHRMSDDVLSHPGEQDLTTTVDWTQITEAGARHGLEVTRLERLDQFLLKEGLLDQIAIMNAGAADTAEGLQLNASAREMIMPNGLAAHFQVMVQRKVS